MAYIEDKNTTKIEEIVIHTDGGSRGNPGPSAAGYVIMTLDGVVVETGGEYLGITTNNQAEYQAVRYALQQAKKYHPRQIKFKIDSQLVVNQMNGAYRIRNRDLWPIHASIRDLIAGFDKVTFEHIYREDNKLADSQVNLILDQQTQAHS